jgi:hypothetical protein
MSVSRSAVRRRSAPVSWARAKYRAASCSSPFLDRSVAEMVRTRWSVAAWTELCSKVRSAQRL